MYDFRNPIEPLEKKAWLSSPTMHGDELGYMTEAYETNWMSTVGENIDRVEEEVASFTGNRYAVALSAGTAAIHLAVKLAGERLYGSHPAWVGSLAGHRVFCSDMTFSATVNPVTYEGGEPVFIDTERETWNMDPAALERAFAVYPDVRLVVIAHLYGTPGKIDEIRSVCRRHGALLVEDAAESLGAEYLTGDTWRQTGTFGDYRAISFNGNKIITGSSGGILLADSKADADRARKWSTQAREAAPWYQHEEVGFNYRMSNVIAGVIRGQIPYLKEHIEEKRAIYYRYKEGLKGLPVSMNPYDEGGSRPNFWLSCLLIDPDAMTKEVRGETDYLYLPEHGKSSPMEILDAIQGINAEGRPIWKPMHLQPIYRTCDFITAAGRGRGQTNAYIEGKATDVGQDIFSRGICLPSDNKMTEETQDRIISVIRASFE